MTEKMSELQRRYIIEAREKALNFCQWRKDLQWLDSRMEDSRTFSLVAQIKQETAMEKDYQERTDHAAIVNAKLDREKRLGMEIANERRKTMVQELRRNYLKENDQTLKTLMRKLNAGYVCKDLQLQIQNNSYRRLQEKADELDVSKKILNASCTGLMCDLMEQQKQVDRTKRYGQELRQQFGTSQSQAGKQNEAIVEKKLMEDLQKAMREEAEKKVEEKKQRTEVIRDEMVRSLGELHACRRQEKVISKAEDQVADTQRELLYQRMMDRKAETKRKLDEKTKAHLILGEKNLAATMAAKERDNLISLLNEQERLEAQIEEEKEKNEKIERVKRETREALLRQMQIKREQEQQEKDSDVGYLTQLKNKMAAEDAKEAEAQHAARAKKDKYRVLLQKQIASASFDDDNLRRAKLVKEYQDKWDKEVAAERAEIIKEHAPQLLGYLQAGVVQQTDLPQVKVGAALRPETAGLRVDALEALEPPLRFSKCNTQCKRIRDY